MNAVPSFAFPPRFRAPDAVSHAAGGAHIPVRRANPAGPRTPEEIPPTRSARRTGFRAPNRVTHAVGGARGPARRASSPWRAATTTGAGVGA